MGRVCTVLTVLVACARVVAAGLVANSDFRTAEGWTVPANSGWGIVNDDGHTDSFSLRYQSAQPAVAGPVTATVACQPKTDYVLSAWLKGDGKLHPVIGFSLGGPLLSPDPAKVWHRVTLRFNSGASTRLQLDLYADERHVAKAAAPAGASWIDEVQILTAAEETTARAAGQAGGGPRNLALRRPYTLSPAPNYSLCTDAGDATQLTDGEYSVGYFWVQQSTVGWSSARPVIMTFDLGQDSPIGGLSFSTAAGVAGVTWPTAVFVYTSDDKQQWWYSGELIGRSAEENGLPPTDAYHNWRFRSTKFASHGRYVALVGLAGGSYYFCDEVEVYEGAASLLQQPRTGKPVASLLEAFRQNTVTAAVRARVTADVVAARQMVQESRLPAARQTALGQELDRAAAYNSSYESPAGAEMVLPYHTGHAQVFKVLGALRAAQGAPALQAWTGSRWDNLQPQSAPPAGATAAMSCTLMRDEIRGAAFNLTNAGSTDQTVHVTVAGLPGGPTPDWLTVLEASWVGTNAGTVTDSALPAAVKEAGGWAIHIPAGLTRMVWLSVDSHRLTAGQWAGQVLVRGATELQVPFKLRVSAVQFPVEPTMQLGGWDYTETFTYGVTPALRESLVKFLKQYHVDTPWAGGSVLSWGTHAADGTMTKPPDTKAMDAWLDRWPEARHYAVFVSANDPVADTPAARRRVAEWINFWVKYLAEKHIKAEQLTLLIHDEPHEAKQDQIILTWARAIRAAQPKVVIWQDPTWEDPRQSNQDTLAACTVLCPNRPMWLTNRAIFEQVFLKHRDQGVKLAFYSCSGPVRSLDPYSYHRLQAWECFRYGAEAEYFWAFSDSGGGSCWNEAAAPATVFCPQFMGGERVITSLHMEGVREGVYDYEYLRMLRDAVAEATKAGQTGPAVDQAKQLLTAGPKRVLDAQGAADIYWAKPKERETADAVRVEVLNALEALKR